MKYIIGFIVACVLWLVVLSNITMPEYVRYDCSIAEFHPDFPPTVKEECRKLRNEYRKQANETTI